MNNTIQYIILNEIPKGCIFDSHSIINFLILNHNDEYLSSNINNWTTAYYHSEISKKIATFEKSLINRLGESWSLNVNNDFCQNKCWVKL